MGRNHRWERPSLEGSVSQTVAVVRHRDERVNLDVEGLGGAGDDVLEVPRRRPAAAAATLGAGTGDKSTSLCLGLKAICPRA